MVCADSGRSEELRHRKDIRQRALAPPTLDQFGAAVEKTWELPIERGTLCGSLGIETRDSPKGSVCSSSPRGITTLPSSGVIKYAANTIAMVDRTHVTTVVTTVLVDSCVIIDLLAAESDSYEWAMATISALSESRSLAINQIIYAEIAAVYDTPADLELARAPFEFIRLSLPWEAAFLSGTAYRIFRQRGGHRPSPLPDF